MQTISKPKLIVEGAKKNLVGSNFSKKADLLIISMEKGIMAVPDILAKLLGEVNCFYFRMGTKPRFGL